MKGRDHLQGKNTKTDTRKIMTTAINITIQISLIVLIKVCGWARLRDDICPPLKDETISAGKFRQLSRDIYLHQRFGIMRNADVLVAAKNVTDITDTPNILQLNTILLLQRETTTILKNMKYIIQEIEKSFTEIMTEGLDLGLQNRCQGLMKVYLQVESDTGGTLWKLKTTELVLEWDE